MKTLATKVFALAAAVATLPTLAFGIPVTMSAPSMTRGATDDQESPVIAEPVDSFETTYGMTIDDVSVKLDLRCKDEGTSIAIDIRTAAYRDVYSYTPSGTDGAKWIDTYVKTHFDLGIMCLPDNKRNEELSEALVRDLYRQAFLRQIPQNMR